MKKRIFILVDASENKVVFNQDELFGNKLALPPLNDEVDTRPFRGTDNPRHLRVIPVLLKQAAVPRSQIDSVARCENGPDLISDLRGRGLSIPCTRVPCIDSDGLPCRPGLYRLTSADRRKIRKWLKARRSAA